MRHIYDFKKTSSSGAPIRRRTKSNYGGREKMMLIIFLIVVGGWIYTFYFSPLFAIKNIHIDGLEKISKSSIEDLLNVSGHNIFRFNPTKATEAVKDAFFIENITINKIYPSTIAVTINEKHAAFELNMPHYKYLLDDDGVVVEIVQSSSTLRHTNNLPLLENSVDRIFNARERTINEKEIEAIIF